MEYLHIEGMEEELPFEIRRSARKTLSMGFSREGILIFRAPVSLPKKNIYSFAKNHAAWLKNHYDLVKEQKKKRKQYSPEDIQAYKQKLKPQLEEKLAFYGALLGVTYERVTIRDQKTRWGSCSSLGNLNFNWRLALVPEELLDYVVVHELAHRLEMNHSPAFWALVEKILPDYRQRREALKKISLSI